MFLFQLKFYITRYNFSIHSTWTFTLFFQPIPPEQENSPLRGYKVLYKVTTTNEDSIEMPIGLDKTGVNITDLIPWTFYDIWVVAYNNVGSSEKSPKKSVRTLPTGKCYIYD